MTSRNIEQCDDIQVTYNTNLIKRAPEVTVFVPKGVALQLNNTFDDPANGVARYMMSLPAGQQAMLLIDGGGGFRETSALFTGQFGIVSSFE